MLQRTHTLAHSRQLRHTDTGHNTCGADAAGSDTHLDGVGASLGQHNGSLARGDIAHHHIDFGIHAFHLLQGFDHTDAVSVRRVDDNGVSTCLDQSIHTVHHVGCDAYAGSHTQATLAVLAGQRALFGLHDVTVGNQPDEDTLVIHHRQLLYLVALQNFGSLGESGTHMCGDQLGDHNLLQRALHVLLKAQVAIGHHAYQFALLVDNGDAADAILAHQAQCILHQGIFGQRDGIHNHTVLGAFHLAHLACLPFDRHILV